MWWLIDHVGRKNILWTWKNVCPLKNFLKSLSQNDVSKECDVDGPLEESKDKVLNLDFSSLKHKYLIKSWGWRDGEKIT